MPTWVIVVLIILMMIGSVVWVRPSPRDQRLAEWRNQAMIGGLKVKLEGVAAEPKDSGIREDIEGVSYILYEHQPIKGDHQNWMVVKDEGWIKDGLPNDWSWYKQADINLAVVISDLIKGAPLPILAIERTPYFSRIVWKETAGDFDAEKLKKYLQAVQATS